MSVATGPCTRHYNSDLSIWLSVDPMSDKYPSMSPYTYCANNPVKLVDPNGREVFIDGWAANIIIGYLSLSAKNLEISLDAKTNKLSVSVKEGAVLSRSEQMLYDAVHSKEVIVNLTASCENKFTSKIHSGLGELPSELGGAFFGNQLQGCDSYESGAQLAFTEQFISLDVLQEHYDWREIGDVIIHEITESYHGGCISLGIGYQAMPATTKDADENSIYIYNWAHDLAAPCPYENTDAANAWKTAAPKASAFMKYLKTTP